MRHLNQPTQAPPTEINLYQRRIERVTEDRKLEILKAQLRAIVERQQSGAREMGRV
jgi:hypothetical protein